MVLIYVRLNWFILFQPYLFFSSGAVNNVPDQERHVFLVEKTSDVGLMFGSKALVQLFVNPFVGIAVDK